MAQAFVSHVMPRAAIWQRPWRLMVLDRCVMGREISSYAYRGLESRVRIESLNRVAEASRLSLHSDLCLWSLMHLLHLRALADAQLR